MLLDKEAVCQLMIATGLWVPRFQRPRPVHQPCSRCACLGELVQVDGCGNAWFKNRTPLRTLLVFADDATSWIMPLHFPSPETSFSYVEAARSSLPRRGKLVAFYSDRNSIFRPTRDPVESGRAVAQSGRALFELDIQGWRANSSRAKSCVERTHLTLQGRLIKELRLRGNSILEAANALAPGTMAEDILAAIERALCDAALSGKQAALCESRFGAATAQSRA